MCQHRAKYISEYLSTMQNIYGYDYNNANILFDRINSITVTELWPLLINVLMNIKLFLYVYKQYTCTAIVKQVE